MRFVASRMGERGRGRDGGRISLVLNVSLGAKEGMVESFLEGGMFGVSLSGSRCWRGSCASIDAE